MKMKSAMKRHKLKQVFDFFDQDGNGYINMEELARIFAFADGEAIAKEVLKDADLNHDGQVKMKKYAI